MVEDYRKEKTQFGSPQTSIMKKVGDMHQIISMEFYVFEDKTFEQLTY